MTTRQQLELNHPAFPASFTLAFSFGTSIRAERSEMSAIRLLEDSGLLTQIATMPTSEHGGHTIRLRQPTRILAVVVFPSALPIKTTDEFGAYARRIYASLGLGSGV